MVDAALATVRPTTVRGVVGLGGPVVGAQVVAVDAANKVIAGPVTTNSLGAFGLPAADLPSSFVIVARGGSVGTKPFSGTLVALARDLSEANNNFVVGVPSTIARVSAATDTTRSPHHHALRAANRLGHMRNLPLGAADQEFDAQRFLADAETHGGLTAYIKTLAKDLDNPSPETSYRFGEARRQIVESGGLGSFIAIHVVEGALVKVGGAGAGKILGDLGLSGPSSQDVMNELNVISGKIDHLAADFRNLSIATKYNNYYQLAQSLNTYSGKVNTYFQALHWLQKKSASPPPAQSPVEKNSASPAPAPASPPPAQSPVEGAWDPYVDGYPILSLPSQPAFAVAQASLDLSTADGLAAAIIQELEVAGALGAYDNAMRGSAGSASLIQAFNQAVSAKGFLANPMSPVPAEFPGGLSSEIDTWWKYMDGEQSQIMYLIEAAREHQKRDLGQALQIWATNRQKQFTMLRGGSIATMRLNLTQAKLEDFTAKNTHTVPRGYFVKRDIPTFFVEETWKERSEDDVKQNAPGYFSKFHAPSVPGVQPSQLKLVYRDHLAKLAESGTGDNPVSDATKNLPGMTTLIAGSWWWIRNSDPNYPNTLVVMHGDRGVNWPDPHHSANIVYTYTPDANWADVTPFY